MIVGKTQRKELFVIKLELNFDENYPKFTTGKLYHIIQNVCKSYTGNFTIKRFDGGVVFEDDSFKEQDLVVVKLSGVNEKEADMIAADLCAFFSLSSVEVSKELVESHTVQDKLETV